MTTDKPVAAPSYVCKRCDVACELVAWPSESSEDFAWFCPCCKCRIRTPEMIQASAERRAAAEGISVEELRERASTLIVKEPLPAATLRRLRSRIEERAQEWTPACEHDTNPWTKEAESNG